MANNISINRITNANVYVDGKSCLGRAEEVTNPVIKHKMADHVALGMVGEMSYASGIEKMEAKIKWNSFYPEVLKKVSNPFQAIQLQVRGNLETWEGGSRTGQQPVVVYMTAQSTESPLGAFKAQDNAELESSFAISYYKLEIDGEVISEIDVEANIWMVNGVDLLAQYRNNLGI